MKGIYDIPETMHVSCGTSAIEANKDTGEIIREWKAEPHYMVLWFMQDWEVRLLQVFGTLEEADKFANEHPLSDDLLVCEIKGVIE